MILHRGWGFFCKAHCSVQGIAKPAHYVVICDNAFEEQEIRPQGFCAVMVGSLGGMACGRRL